MWSADSIRVRLRNGSTNTPLSSAYAACVWAHVHRDHGAPCAPSFPCAPCPYLCPLPAHAPCRRAPFPCPCPRKQAQGFINGNERSCFEIALPASAGCNAGQWFWPGVSPDDLRSSLTCRPLAGCCGLCHGLCPCPCHAWPLHGHAASCRLPSACCAARCALFPAARQHLPRLRRAALQPPAVVKLWRPLHMNKDLGTDYKCSLTI